MRTRRTQVGLRVLLFGVAFALPVLADAPNEGPDRQYDSFVSEDKEISDHFTQLVWERGVPAKMSLSDAITYCKNGSRRIPTLKELLTIVDEKPHLEYDINLLLNVPRTIDQSGFPKTPAEAFWTSSVRLNGKYVTVDFKDGTTSEIDPDVPRRVRCVRVGP